MFVQAKAVFKDADVDKTDFLGLYQIERLLTRMHPLSRQKIPFILRKIFSCRSSSDQIERMVGKDKDKDIAKVRITKATFTEWCEEEVPSGLVSVAIFFIQTFGLIASRSEYFGVLDLFNLEIEDTLGSCTAPGMPLFMHLVMLLVKPAVSCLVIVITFITARCANSEHSRMLHAHHLQRGLLLVAMLVFAPLTRGCVSLLVCRFVEEYDVWYLVQDMSVQCFAGEHLTVAIISAGLLLIYAIGMPIFLVYKVRCSQF